jgi:deoxyadenosine/deoxycytidine kinase
MPKHILFVDGLIGSGKTTTITKIKEKYPHLTVIFEPVERWMESGLLTQFYKDPKTYCFQLQSFIMDSFVDELEKAFKDNVDFILMERGHLAAYTIFSYIHWKNDILTDEEYKMMEDKHYVYDRDLRQRGYVLDHIYLNTPIDTAMERIAIRNRGNEKESIKKEYQEGFLKRYEELCLTPYSLEQLNDLIDKLVTLNNVSKLK